MRINNTKKVLKHLRTLGSISPGEAILVHKMVRLAPRIAELRSFGHHIRTARRQDAAGDFYTSYVYTGAGLPNTGIAWVGGEKIHATSA